MHNHNILNISCKTNGHFECQNYENPDFPSSVWLKGWKMIYCYPTLKVLKHEYRIARNAINFPASCMCSSTIKRFPTETKFLLHSYTTFTTEMS